MSKLFLVELKNMFNKFDVKMSILVFALLGLFLGYLNKINDNEFCSSMFEWIMIITMTISALGGLFISKDYTQNTIRNKIIVGHTRLSIYLSKQFAVSLMYLACTGAYIFTSLISNSIFVGIDNVDFKIMMTSLLVAFFAIIACSSITTFISMSLKKETGGLLPLLVMYALMLVGAMGSEFFKGKVMDFICEIVPVCQLLFLNLVSAPLEPLKLIIFSVLITVMFISGGYYIFKKTNLN